jgi:hypothetical protein
MRLDKFEMTRSVDIHRQQSSQPAIIDDPLIARQSIAVATS